jgi:hypothetical protein
MIKMGGLEFEKEGYWLTEKEIICSVWFHLVGTFFHFFDILAL